jgi:hypothetical protein
MLTEGGRLVLVSAVLMMLSIYQMLSLDLPAWVIKAINKICRKFFWKQSEDMRNGSSKVSWDQVCKSKLLGGLGIHNLRVLNDALRIRWCWLEKEGALRAWSGLTFTLSDRAETMALAAIDCHIGDGNRTYFWYDRWIRGESAADLEPDLLAFVSPKKALLMTP